MRLRLALVLSLAACTEPPPARREPSTVVVTPVAAADAGIRTKEEPVADAGGRCEVALGATLAANVYRGVRNTPNRQATLDRLDPQTREQWYGRDHGVTYLLCKYAVRMNGDEYTYEHVAGQQIGFGHDLDTATCSTAATRTKVAKEIRESTHDCTDAHAGAYWGFDLVPVR